MTASLFTRESLDDAVAALRAGRQDMMANPWQLYARLREQAPAYRSGDVVMITRWEDVYRLHTTPEEFGQRRENTYPVPGAPPGALSSPEQHRLMQEIGEVTGRWLSFQEGDDHQRLRRLAQKAFSARSVARMDARIAEIAESLINTNVTGDSMEIVHDFAFQLPLMVVCEMLEVPPEDRFKIREWTSGLAAFTDWGVSWGERDELLRKAHSCAQNLHDHLNAVFDAHEGGEGGTLLGDLLNAEEEGDRFAREELVGMCVQVIRAGHETTTNLISVGLHSLMTNRDQWDILREEPGLVPNAVEELIRFKSPTQKNERVARVDQVIAGVEVRRNDRMGLFLGSANRDPDHWNDPDRLDVTRKDVRHLGFGWGAHHCLGSALNRLETSVALRTFLRRFPDMRLATEEVTWKRLWTFCGLEALPVDLGADCG